MALIVTLTSTSVRLPVLRYTLLSLFEQNCKPDRIVICLSKEPYLVDQGVKKLPSWLEAMLVQDQLEINWVENTGPYRKLIPTYKEATDEDWIVTCDDDVIYGPGWLSSLVQAGREYPSSIVCGRARRPVDNFWKKKQSYLRWPLVPSGSKGKDLLPIGIAGVLYRKSLLDQNIMFSADFKKLAPKQDDLWFNLARQLANTDVVVSLEANEYVYPISAPAALYQTNARSWWYDSDSFLKTVFIRFFIMLKSYLGISVCDNDIVIKRLDNYLKKMRH